MKTFVITGATSGIGKMTALAVAQNALSNRIIFNTRDPQKGEEVRQALIHESGNKNIYCFEGDFASLQSVKTFAQQVLAQFPVVDVLLNNAGTWEMTFQESQDGIEMNFAVNHLAPFLLTRLLLPALKKSASARIINTASGAHRRNILQFDDIEFRQGAYNGFFSYAQSKLCNLLFSVHLEAVLAQEKVPHITVNSLHPGVVKTALFDKMSDEERAFFGNFVSPEEGAMTSIFLTLSDEVEGISGKYWHKHREAESTDMAKDSVLAQQLWEVSLNYVKNFI
jgi:NAD(P)-dependent dehydrogenase (short-subunit alcohol dehydrogenase family)